MERLDFLVLGAGMAGAGIAYELAGLGSVAVLERESQPGYHATGRSAAIYTQVYGPAPVRALTVAGWDFFTAPPSGFSEAALLKPRPLLLIGRPDQAPLLDAAHAEGRRLAPTIARLDRTQTLDRAPFLRPDYVAGAVLEPQACDLDVHALLMGYLRGLSRRGGRLVTGAEALGLSRRAGLWTVDTGAGSFTAPVLINAAGAWADQVAGLAGIGPIGLTPKRRSAFTFDPVFADPADRDGLERWPSVIDVAETFYVKPDAGRLLGSPADETPTAPCDVQSEELDIAVAIDRIEQAARFTVRRIAHRWAGLRSFVADKVPVVGFDQGAEGFFWLAGQGGYGIQTAPALSRAAAALAAGRGLPAELTALGLDPAQLAPARLR